MVPRLLLGLTAAASSLWWCALVIDVAHAVSQLIALLYLFFSFFVLYQAGADDPAACVHRHPALPGAHRHGALDSAPHRRLRKALAQIVHDHGVPAGGAAHRRGVRAHVIDAEGEFADMARAAGSTPASAASTSISKIRAAATSPTCCGPSPPAGSGISSPTRATTCGPKRRWPPSSTCTCWSRSFPLPPRWFAPRRCGPPPPRTSCPACWWWTRFGQS